ncbi:hypothetical protein GCM10011610_68610 [Nocardia rhizosphaerihabitans]|uniref:Knr4/Smi1-like domain-containing protein n=1 Tax=Nocardia rhizosphaerihabitans TaxID=1691570 RepID=A0ABQ2L481_9NOCA|nr:hypothetical protein GCM10011610_68610 [Nocardia rhizosphaerihabitans]
MVPGFVPLPIDRVASWWESMTRTWASWSEEFGYLAAEPAGTTTFHYISAYIPFAENGSGELLFLDTRHGRHHGGVGHFAGDAADQCVRLWPSLRSALDDVVSSLEGQRPCRGWIPIVEDGVLDWDLP